MSSAFLPEFQATLNQIKTHSVFDTRGGFDAKTYNDAPINCRFEGKRRLVTTPTGDRLISSTTVFTDATVGYEDLIDGRRVLQVLDMVDGDGLQLGVEVLLQ